MPIYEYRCRNGHTFEVFQSMSEDPVARCEECDAPVERVFHPVAVVFKGSGFYTTDYARKGAKADGGKPNEQTPASGKGGATPASPESSAGSGEGRGSGEKATGDKKKTGSSSSD